MKPTIILSLPQWLDEAIQTRKNSTFADNSARMKFVLELASRNIEEKTGGPFAAAIFEREEGRLLGAGVNLVQLMGQSYWHAETVCIAVAQASLGHYDLSMNKVRNCQLVSAAQPCAMCAGAIPWTGIKEVLFAASKEDTESICGFDEGPVHPQWVLEYEQRGIKVVQHLREQGREVLRKYKNQGGFVFQPGANR